MILLCETFFDPIGNRYLIPKEQYRTNIPMLKIMDKLNEHIKIAGGITYRDYFDILKEFFERVNIPGTLLDVHDFMIPVSSFYWKLNKSYSDIERINGKWKGKEGSEQYSWTLNYYKKEAV